MSNYLDRLRHRPILSLLILSAAARIFTLSLLYTAKQIIPTLQNERQPQFTNSTSRLEAFVRWDTLYFIDIALDGYATDKVTAFMPGLPLLMRYAGNVIMTMRGGQELLIEDTVIAGILLAFLAGVSATLVLYKLTLTLTRSSTIAYTTSLLLIISPSPATLNASPYTEPFAALFTFLGMLFFVRQRWFMAAVWWTIGASFRAQGLLLGIGFFGWQFVIGSIKRRTLLTMDIPRFIIFSSIVAAPFFLFQIWVYRQFCSIGQSLPRPWCTKGIGLSYGWVQSEYWNVGPFRYWTFLQLPNFILALPLLLLSFFASYDYYSHDPHHVLSTTFPFLPATLLPPPPLKPKSKKKHHERAFLTPSLLPFIHLHTAITLLLVVASHVQIILRVSATNPVIFWYASDLVTSSSLMSEEEPVESSKEGEDEERRKAREKRGRWGKRWIQYCLSWGFISLILWAGYYPPA